MRLCCLLLGVLLLAGCSQNPGDELIRLSGSTTEGDRQMASQMLKDHPELLNYKDAKGVTPLHAAAGAFSYGLLTLYISKGADVNAQDNAGNTPLHWAFAPDAAQAGGAEAGSQPATSGGGTGPNVVERVKGARAKNRQDCIRVLLNKGADRNHKNKAGKTPAELTPDGDEILRYYDEGAL